MSKTKLTEEQDLRMSEFSWQSPFTKGNSKNPSYPPNFFG